MYCVSIKLWKHDWKFGRTRNAVEHELQASVSTAFSSNFSQTFTSVFITYTKTENMFFMFLENSAITERENNLLTLNIKM